MKPPSVTVPNPKPCPSLWSSITNGAQLKIMPKTMKSHQQRRPTPNHAQFYEIHSKAMPNSEPSASLRRQFKTVPNWKSYPSQWNPTETVPDSQSDPSPWNPMKSAPDSKSCPSLWKPLKAAPNSRSCPSLRNPFKNGARLVWGRFTHTTPNKPTSSTGKEMENSRSRLHYLKRTSRLDGKGNRK